MCSGILYCFEANEGPRPHVSLSPTGGGLERALDRGPSKAAWCPRPTEAREHSSQGASRPLLHRSKPVKPVGAAGARALTGAPGGGGVVWAKNGYGLTKQERIEAHGMAMCSGILYCFEANEGPRPHVSLSPTGGGLERALDRGPSKAAWCPRPTEAREHSSQGASRPLLHRSKPVKPVGAAGARALTGAPSTTRSLSDKRGTTQLPL